RGKGGSGLARPPAERAFEVVREPRIDGPTNQLGIGRRARGRFARVGRAAGADDQHGCTGGADHVPKPRSPLLLVHESPLLGPATSAWWYAARVRSVPCRVVIDAVRCRVAPGANAPWQDSIWVKLRLVRWPPPSP